MSRGFLKGIGGGKCVCVCVRGHLFGPIWGKKKICAVAVRLAPTTADQQWPNCSWNNCSERGADVIAQCFYRSCAATCRLCSRRRRARGSVMAVDVFAVAAAAEN